VGELAGYAGCRLGLAGPVSEEEFDRLEEFYRSREKVCGWRLVRWRRFAHQTFRGAWVSGYGVQQCHGVAFAGLGFQDGPRLASRSNWSVTGNGFVDADGVAGFL